MATEEVKTTQTLLQDVEQLLSGRAPDGCEGKSICGRGPLKKKNKQVDINLIRAPLLPFVLLKRRM